MISVKEIDLRYSDSDQMGVVYHANYFSFFEMGRTHMLKEQGIEYYKIEEMGYIFPVRGIIKDVEAAQGLVDEINRFLFRGI